MTIYKVDSYRCAACGGGRYCVIALVNADDAPQRMEHCPVDGLLRADWKIQQDVANAETT